MVVIKRKDDSEAALGGVKSCLRALEVIEYFRRTHEPARTVDIREALGIPNSSADEILRTLAARGYLSYDRVAKRYAPSYKLVATLRGIERGFFGNEEVADQVGVLLKELNAETGASVYLALQNDCWVEHVATVHGSWMGDDAAGRWPTEVVHFERGHWCPGNNFAAALLTQKSNVEIIAIATRAQSLGLGPQGPAVMKDLIDRVARARARGFSLCRRNGRVAQADSIAFPLVMPNSVSPYAVGLVGDVLFDTDQDVTQLATTMRTLIARHSAALNAAH